jgi:integrase/recombinase XerD
MVTHKKNTVRNCEFLSQRLQRDFGDRDINTIKADEVIDFLSGITSGRKQATKRNRYAVLSSLFNFISNSFESTLSNPCSAPAVKKLFKSPKLVNWTILDKDVVDEIIFRTMNVRNRLILELMARAGMRIGEVLKLTIEDIDGQRLRLREPKSGREAEIVYLPKKLADRLQQYVAKRELQPGSRIFPITYVAAWHIVKKAGKLVDVKISPHDLRRHAATYASRAGTPIEIVSKVILRHSSLSTTQRYLGKVSDQEAMHWIENLYG